MPESFLTPDVVEMITALISVFIALIALWEMRRMRHESTYENREIRRGMTEIRERIAAVEVKQN